MSIIGHQENNSFVMTCTTGFKAVMLVFVDQVTESSKKRVGRSSNRHESLNTSMMKRILYIIVTDLMCWLPIVIMSLMSYGGYRLPEIAHTLSTVVFLPINSFLNPVIYSRIDKSILRKVTKFIASCRRYSSNERKTYGLDGKKKGNGSVYNAAHTKQSMISQSLQRWKRSAFSHSNCIVVQTCMLRLRESLYYSLLYSLSWFFYCKSWFGIACQ